MAAAAEPAGDAPVEQHRSVGRSYTRGRTAPYLIRKWPGSRMALPLGPYTLTQLVVLVGSVVVLIRFANWWAFFGGFNLVIGVGLPVGLTYATRHTRIEGRDPIRAALSWAGYLTQPRSGYLRGRGWRSTTPVRQPGRAFVVAPAPAAAPRTATVTATARRARPATRPVVVTARATSLAELLAAAERAGR